MRPTVPPDSLELRTSLSGDLDAIVLTALDKEPAGRYRTVAAFLGRYPASSRRRPGECPKAELAAGAPVIAHAARPRLWQCWRVAVCATSFAVFYRIGVRSSLNVRPSVAVLGFQNLSNQPSAEWLSTALTEMLSTELAAGGRLRTVPGELVSRVKVEMALPNLQTLTKPTLGRLRDNLSADYVVVGAYLAFGEGAGYEGHGSISACRTRETANSWPPLRRRAPCWNSSTWSPMRAPTAPPVRRRSVWPIPISCAARCRTGPRPPVTTPRGSNACAPSTRSARVNFCGTPSTAAPAHALSHAALAAASGLLGYDVEARDEAKKALDLSGGTRARRASFDRRPLFRNHARVGQGGRHVSDAPHRIPRQPGVRAAPRRRADPGRRLAARHSDASFAARSAFRRRAIRAWILPRRKLSSPARTSTPLAMPPCARHNPARRRVCEFWRPVRTSSPAASRSNRAIRRARCRSPPSRSSCTWRSGTARVWRGRSMKLPEC